MHPYLLERLAADHIGQMRAQAAADRLARQTRRDRRAARRAGVRARSGAAAPAMPPAGAHHRGPDPVAGEQRELARGRAA
jgi:hypothetical protein